MRLLYWMATFMLACSIINIYTSDLKYSFPIVNGVSSTTEEDIAFVIMLFDNAMSMIYVKLVFSLSFFSFFLIKIIEEKIYYLKPLTFAVLLSLMDSIKTFIILIEEKAIGDYTDSRYLFIYLYLGSLLIYGSILLFFILKNKNQQYPFKWNKKKESINNTANLEIEDNNQ